MRALADAVVIGGGVVGSSIAYNLMKQGMKRVVLCEKDTFASGSTGRCGAGVREQWGSEGNIKICKASIDIFEGLQEELQYDYDIEFVQKGYLMMAYTEKEWDQFQKNVEVQHKLGVNAIPVSYTHLDVYKRQHGLSQPYELGVYFLIIEGLVHDLDRDVFVLLHPIQYVEAPAPAIPLQHI